MYVNFKNKHSHIRGFNILNSPNTMLGHIQLQIIEQPITQPGLIKVY